MKWIFFFPVAILLSLLQGCTSPHVITLWKPEPLHQVTYNKIMVVSIVNNENDTIRAAREKYFTDKLSGLGYTAISAFTEFGSHGFSELEEEAAYLKLCDNGIDAILTLARVDYTKAKPDPGNIKYTSAYYYNRIWSYSKLETGKDVKEYVWESILFDLVFLEPRFVGHTKPFDIQSSKNMDAEISEWIINKMKKEKIISVQRRNPG